MRTTFESGNWVEHRPIQDLKGADKRALDKVGKPQPVFDGRGEFDQAATISGLDVMGWVAAKRDAVWALAVTGWSYELPVPVLDKASGEVSGAESFGELPLDDFEELEALLAPFEVKLERKPDPKGVTTSASNGSSRASGAHSSRKG